MARILNYTRVLVFLSGLSALIANSVFAIPVEVSDLVSKSCPAAEVETAKKIITIYSEIFKKTTEDVKNFDLSAASVFQEIAIRFSTLQGTIEEASGLLSTAGFQLISTADLSKDATVSFYALIVISNAFDGVIVNTMPLNCAGFSDFYSRMIYLKLEFKNRIPALAIQSQILKKNLFEKAMILLSQVDKPALPGGIHLGELHGNARCPDYSHIEGLSASEVAELKYIDGMYEKEFLQDLQLCCNQNFNFTALPPVPQRCNGQDLDSREYQALLQFTQSCSGKMNYALYSGDPAILEECDSVIYKMEKALSHFPDHRGTVRRGATKDQSYLDTIQPGQDFIEKNFMSTSAIPDWQWSGNVLLKIVSLHGKHIVDFSPFGMSEDEVVMQPFSKFRVLSKQFDVSLNRTVIEYQELKK